MAADQAGSAADRFSHDPWEQRAARLERLLGEKNHRILELEQRLGEQEQRLHRAVARLRQAEETVEAQAAVTLLEDRPSSERAAPPDYLARLASEKGALEARARQLGEERDRLLEARSEDQHRARSAEATAAAARAAIGEREKALATLEERLQQAETVAARRGAGLEARVSELEEERDRAISRSRGANDSRDKAEVALRNAEEQTALYRRNLLQAEETLRSRERELGETRRASDERQGELEETRVELSHLKGEHETLRALARSQAAAAEQVANQLRRTLARLGLALLARRQHASATEDRLQQANRSTEARLGQANRRHLVERDLRAHREAELAGLRAELDSARDGLELAASRESTLEDALLASKLLAARAARVGAEQALRRLVALGAPIEITSDGDSRHDERGGLLGWLRRP